MKKYAEKAYQLALEYKEKNKDWRWGQCVFNAYADIFPEITVMIRGTEDDCFYNDDLVPKFLKHFSEV